MQNDHGFEQASRPRSHQEKRERLFEVMEKKIAMARDLWRVAKAWAPPRPDDAELIIQKENDDLHAILKRAREEFSEASADNTQFIGNIEQGINKALEKRHKIRTILKEVEDVNNPAAYQAFLPKGVKEATILKIVPARFSLNVLATPEIFKERPTVHGLHYKGTIWNMINPEKIEEDIKRVRMQRFADRLTKAESAERQHNDASLTPLQEEVETKIQVTIGHEDFHSFIEGFSLPTGWKTAIKEIKESIANLKQMEAQTMPLDEEQKRLKHKLKRFTDLLVEELAAEIATLPHEYIPQTTFVTAIEKLKEELQQQVQSAESLGIKPILEEVTRELDVEQLKASIQAMYKKVKEHAPNHLEDLDSAFVLFPPSQWRHIERLVARWTNS